MTIFCSIQVHSSESTSLRTFRTPSFVHDRTFYFDGSGSGHYKPDRNLESYPQEQSEVSNPLGTQPVDITTLPAVVKLSHSTPTVLVL